MLCEKCETRMLCYELSDELLRIRDENNKTYSGYTKFTPTGRKAINALIKMFKPTFPERIPNDYADDLNTLWAVVDDLALDVPVKCRTPSPDEIRNALKMTHDQRNNPWFIFDEKKFKHRNDWW